MSTKAEVMANPIPKSPEVLITEIAMKSQGYHGHFLLLEGSFDMRFWEGRLNATIIKRIECVGKPNLLKTLALAHLQPMASRIWALADRDFDQLLNQLVQSPQLVYTDENDLELTLLLCIGSVGQGKYIERIISGTTDSEKLMQFQAQQGCSLIECLREMVAQFGVLRYLNEKHGFSVNFDKLSILNLKWFDDQALNLTLMNLHNEFIQQVTAAQPATTFSPQQLASEISTCTSQGLLTNWQLVQGHDFLKLLGKVLSSNSLKLKAASQQTSEASLHRDLILMVEKSSLQSTAMGMSFAQLIPNQQIFQ